MLNVSIDKILPVTEARANIARLVDEVEKGDVYVITRGGKPAAVMVPVSRVGIIRDAENVQNVKVVENVGKDKNIEDVKNIQTFKNDTNTDIVKVKKTEDLPVPFKKKISDVVAVQDVKDVENNDITGIPLNKVEEQLNQVQNSQIY